MTLYKSARRLGIFLPIMIFFLLNFQFPKTTFAAPAAQASPQVETYDQLVHAIREVQAATEKRIDRAINQEKVRAAWETGKLIDTHVLQHKERADYGEQVLVKLAKDLGTSQTELKYRLQFFRAYPIGRPADQLTWSHYQALLSLNDPKEREEVTREALRKGWSRDQLREEIRKRKAGRKQTEEKIPEPALTAAPGKIGIYRVIRAKAGPFAGELGLDLGFAIYFQPKEIRKFKEGELVALTKGKLKSFKGSNEDRYTYPAYISEVIDGDTVKAVIDLGFNIVTEQKLRLRGLDAPEIETAGGQKAKAWFASVLASPKGKGAKQSPVLIRTVKSDKYDRYLADIWVGETYINQELIDQELAVRVSE